MTFRGVFSKVFICVMGVAVIVMLDGCSISDSVGSISKSSESFSDSSKSSSKGEENNAKKTSTVRYESEIRDYTVAYLHANLVIKNQSAFMNGISDIATDNGIVDWEANPKTFQAIGAGMKRANISSAQYAAYRQKLAGGDSEKMADIQVGYEK